MQDKYQANTNDNIPPIKKEKEKKPPLNEVIARAKAKVPDAPPSSSKISDAEPVIDLSH